MLDFILCHTKFKEKCLVYPLSMVSHFPIDWSKQILKNLLSLQTPFFFWVNFIIVNKHHHYNSPIWEKKKHTHKEKIIAYSIYFHIFVIIIISHQLYLKDHTVEQISVRMNCTKVLRGCLIEIWVKWFSIMGLKQMAQGLGVFIGPDTSRAH